jgi:predicted NBD/HSP70 family sugar kinase
MTYILFDIGGTKTRVATSVDLQSITAHMSFKTPAKFEDGMKQIAAAVKELTTEKITAATGGIRGPLTFEKTGIQNDSVLTKWIGKSVVGELGKVLKADVLLENDAALAGVGEAIFGAGKGLEIVAYHTVSTGVGGVKVINGLIDAASVGFEPGKQILDIDRTILGDDITPTLENLVSGAAIEERFGVKPYEIPQSDIIWNELAEYLAQGLRNTVFYWSPDVIVLGGSMIIGDPRIEVDAVRKYTVEALDGFVDSPLITAAKLGDEAGLYGAMALLQQQKKKK